MKIRKLFIFFFCFLVIIISGELWFYHSLSKPKSLPQEEIHEPRVIDQREIQPVVKQKEFYLMRLGEVDGIKAERESSITRYSFGNIEEATTGVLKVNNQYGEFFIKYSPQGKIFSYTKSTGQDQLNELAVNSFAEDFKEGSFVLVYNFKVEGQTITDYQTLLVKSNENSAIKD